MFESGSHIIIGLPDIARTFGALFIKMVKKAMDNNPAFFRHSEIKPSVQQQAVINHSCYMGQSLLMLSNSSTDDDSMSGRKSISSDSNDNSHLIESWSDRSKDDLDDDDLDDLSV